MAFIFTNGVHVSLGKVFNLNIIDGVRYPEHYANDI